jgi:hypothetical protein
MRTLAFFLEGEFTLLIVIFVLSTTPILTTLCCGELAIVCGRRRG